VHRIGFPALTLLAACGATKPMPVVHGGPNLALPALALAPTVLLNDLEGHSPEQAFAQGSLVGNIWFSGGFEILPEAGNQVRSVTVSIDQVDAREAQVAAWLDAAMATALTAQAAPWSPLGHALTPPPPTRAAVRGTGVIDGRDNQNLPRVALTPRALPAVALPASAQQEGGPTAILVPMVIHHYSHNAGWFVGQDKGTDAGARSRLLATLYDAQTGAVLTWKDIAARHEEENSFSPNHAALEDYLMAVEAQVAAALAEGLTPNE
jgi:hypothetical protein